MGIREAKKAAKRAMIIKVGREIFTQEGYDRCSVEKIIASAGIARGTFYLYFPSKKSLFDALLEDLYSPIIDILLVTYNDLCQLQKGFTERYLQSAISLAQILERNRDMLIVHFREVYSAGPSGDSVRKWRGRVEAIIEDILQIAIDKDLIRNFSPKLSAMSMFGAAERMVWAWLQKETEINRKEIAQMVADVFWQGLK